MSHLSCYSDSKKTTDSKLINEDQSSNENFAAWMLFSTRNLLTVQDGGELCFEVFVLPTCWKLKTSDHPARMAKNPQPKLSCMRNRQEKIKRSNQLSNWLVFFFKCDETLKMWKPNLARGFGILRGYFGLMVRRAKTDYDHIPHCNVCHCFVCLLGVFSG